MTQESAEKADSEGGATDRSGGLTDRSEQSEQKLEPTSKTYVKYSETMKKLKVELFMQIDILEQNYFFRFDIFKNRTHF